MWSRRFLEESWYKCKHSWAASHMKKEPSVVYPSSEGWAMCTQIVPSACHTQVTSGHNHHRNCCDLIAYEKHCQGKKAETIDTHGLTKNQVVQDKGHLSPGHCCHPHLALWSAEVHLHGEEERWPRYLFLQKTPTCHNQNLFYKTITNLNENISLV